MSLRCLFGKHDWRHLANRYETVAYGCPRCAKVIEPFDNSRTGQRMQRLMTAHKILLASLDDRNAIVRKQ